MFDTINESLSKEEAERLASELRKRQGYLTAAHKKTGLSVFTIKRATLGMAAKPETIKKLRDLLAEMQTISEIELTNEG